MPLYKFFIMQNGKECRRMRDDKKERSPPSFRSGIVKKVCCCASIVSIFASFFRPPLFFLPQQTHESRTDNKSFEWLLENIRAEEKTREKIRRTL
jgi:hypothetical protein